MNPMQEIENSQQEIALLRRQLEEATETLRAIRKGEVDALVVEGAAGPQVYALQTADHPYRVLVEQMNEGALVLTREGFILHANPSFGSLVMAQPQDLGAASVQDWIAAADRTQFEQCLASALEGKAQRVELSLIPKLVDSAPVPVVVSLAPLNLDSVEGVCAVVTDLRERRHRETLERAEVMARSLMDHATAAVVITDHQGQIQRANAAALALTGFSTCGERLETVFPLAFGSETPNAQPVSIALLLRRAIAGESLRGLQASMQTRNGQTVELQVSARPFAPVPNEISGAVFTFADVTALRTSERHFRALADSIPQIVWTTDRSGRLQYCNSVGTGYFGLTVEEMPDSGERVVHPDDLLLLLDLWRGCLESGTPLQMECRLKSRWGEFTWFLLRAVPVRDARGQIIQWFGTSTDVDAQKKIESDLRQANADLEHFAYAVSHDFQESLRMITAYAQLLETSVGGQLQGAGAISLKYVLEGTDRLGTLLRNLVSYIRASRGPEAPPEEIDCNEVLEEVLGVLRVQIQQSGAAVRSTALPHIVCPRVHMFEVFQNLVSNAIKYRGADPPEIGISAFRNDRHWVFSVRDNGIGIAPQYQQNVFGVFQRLHGSNIPGTGIGLAICRRLLEQHGGRIWVQSQVNCGSVFYFSLPAVGVEKADGAARA